jgi:hypothetical protein
VIVETLAGCDVKQASTVLVATCWAPSPVIEETVCGIGSALEGGTGVALGVGLAVAGGHSST